VKRGYAATPEEIGLLRREIREALRSTWCPAFLPLKVASLDETSFTWLIQRMRPKELRMVQQWRTATP
jgi:hypothetical protein